MHSNTLLIGIMFAANVVAAIFFIVAIIIGG